MFYYVVNVKSEQVLLRGSRPITPRQGEAVIGSALKLKPREAAVVDGVIVRKPPSEVAQERRQHAEAADVVEMQTMRDLSEFEQLYAAQSEDMKRLICLALMLPRDLVLGRM
jgi:hypothetical protein